MVTILLVSSIPGHSLPQLKILSWDKLWHFIEYSILGLLLMKNVNPFKFRLVIMVILAGFVFAGFDEFWQSFIPGRTSSIYDAIADGMGIITGSVISMYRTLKK